MARAPRPPLTVSGRCPKCKAEVKTTAEKGRTTWRGPCPTVGCGGRVIARRAPVQPSGAAKGKRTPEPAPEEPKTSTTSTRRPRRRIPRVEYDRGANDRRPDRPPAASEGAPAEVRGAGPAGERRPGGDDDEHDYRSGPPAGEHTIRARPVDEDGNPTERQPAGRRRTRRTRSEAAPRRSAYPDLYDW